MDHSIRQHQELCRRAERMGYDGDIADLYDDEPYEPIVIVERPAPRPAPPMESGRLVALTGAVGFVCIIVGLLLLPAVQR